MNKVNILHISDLHYSYNNDKSIELLLSRMIEDINDLCKKHDMNIDLVFFTGDLVKIGQDYNLFEQAHELFVIPLLRNLSLGLEKFIFVPGNHELSRENINVDHQNAFSERICREKAEKENFIDPFIMGRLENYNKYISEKFNMENIQPVNSVKINVNDVDCGITMFNTAWCSSSYSDKDAKHIVMPVDLSKLEYDKIKNCQIKFALMHHPLDWFEDDNAAAFQHILYNYNIITSGHKHSEVQNIQYNSLGTSVFNYSNKLLPMETGHSGFSVISYDKSENSLKCFHRSYNSRLDTYECYKLNKDQSQEYLETFLNHTNSAEQIAYKTVNSLKKNFKTRLDKLFITNLLVENRKKYHELFIEPEFTKTSIYNIETSRDTIKGEEQKFNTNEIINKNSILKIYGAKESGKTIIANDIVKKYLDRFEDYKKLPVLLDGSEIGKTNINLVNAIYNFISEYAEDEYSISKNDVLKVLNANHLVLVIDNFEQLTNKQLKELDQIKSHKVVIANENPLKFSEENISTIESKFDLEDEAVFFISRLDKKSIRNFIKVFSESESEENNLSNISTYFQKTALPRTPFLVSIISVLLSTKNETVPTNQAKIMEQFMEKLLEKLNPIEKYSNTYDFSNKESFLSELAYKIYSSNNFSISKTEFIDFTEQYHRNKGYSLKDSLFDKIFFEKEILSLQADKIHFRFECLNYYYLAKYLIKNNILLKNFVNEEQIIMNAETITYYTGLKRDDCYILNIITNAAEKIIVKYNINTSPFDDNGLKTNLGLLENDNFVNNTLSKPKVSTEEKDKITETKDNSDKYNPLSIYNSLNRIENIDEILSMLAVVIKNSEELDVSIKEKSMHVLLKGCTILWNEFNKKLMDFAKKVNEQIIQKNSDSTPDELKEAYDYFSDILKLSVPLAISHMLFENTATKKMNSVYEKMLNSYSYDTPEKMFLSYLISDLNKNNISTLLDLVKNGTNKNYQMVNLFKMLYYYFFENSNDKRMPNAIADCHAKITGSKSKTKVIQDIKDKKFNKDLLDLK